MSSFTLATAHGLISITDTALKNDGPTLLLIHGNSSSSRIFRHMLDSPTITSRWRFVTFDLPGHGSSSKAPSPEKSYHMRGYAELAVYILHHLNIESVVIFGWSLGGHVGIEMIPLLLQAPVTTLANHKKIEVKGLMLTGAPPVLGKEQVSKGFTFSHPSDTGLGLAGTKDWTDADALSFSRNSAAAGKDEYWESWMHNNARNTDGRARMWMARKFTGIGNAEDGKEEQAEGVDQRSVVETSDVLIAVVNGAEEQFVNLDYLDAIRWKRLWRGKCARLEGLGHAPFWERPDVFEPILVNFLDDCGEEDKGQ